MYHSLWRYWELSLVLNLSNILCLFIEICLFCYRDLCGSPCLYGEGCDDPCCWSWVLLLVPEPANCIKWPNCLNGNTCDLRRLKDHHLSQGRRALWFRTLLWCLACVVFCCFLHSHFKPQHCITLSTMHRALHTDFADYYRNTFIFFNCFHFIILFCLIICS